MTIALKSKTYLLTLFYPSIKSAASHLAKAREIVAIVSLNDFHVLGHGESICCITFSSELAQEDLGRRFDLLTGEQFLLVEISSVICGRGNRSDAYNWLAKRVEREA